MIVISNHVKTIGMKYPPGSLIRINLAWIDGIEDVKAIIKNTRGHKIYLDYPTGRRKPPAPKFPIEEAIKICNKNRKKIAYFAFSNAEDPEAVKLIRSQVHPSVKLAPKIETQIGVNNLKQIAAAAQTDMIMLDAEDLYTDCKTDPATFSAFKELARQSCKDIGINCLELKGVVFSHESKP